MRHGTPPIASLGRSLSLLEAIIADRDDRSVPQLAEQLGLPRATAHRQVTTFVAEGFLARIEGGRIVAGPRLLALMQRLDATQPLVAAAAPVLHRLAVRLRCLVQLGTLDNDMVTYRIKTGLGSGAIFTKVGMQLEAYCTGIGKVLLAHLVPAEREAYLATGPFPAVTAHTITDPAMLRVELAEVAEQGFARDREEIAEGLVCLAVPVRSADGRVIAAISASRPVAHLVRLDEVAVIERLRASAGQIGELLVRSGTPDPG
jgi:DNA-binding IclR family transcriptional regulator